MTPPAAHLAGIAARWVAVIAFLAHLLAAPSVAQFTVAETENYVDVAVGTDPPPFTLIVQNTGATDLVLEIQSGALGIAVAPAEPFVVAAEGTAEVEITLFTSFLEPGEYLDFVTLREAIPSKQAGPEVFVSFSVLVYQPGPPSVTDLFFEASPIETLPNGVRVGSGSYVGIGLAVTGTPPFEFLWQFSSDGATWDTVVAGPGVRGIDEIYLEFESVDLSRSGSYRCAVSGAQGSLFSPIATLIVDPPPPSIANPEPRTVAEGLLASFHTRVLEGEPTGFRWEFQGDTGPFLALTDAGDGVQGALTPDLTIPEATPARAGLYRCVVSFGETDLESAPALLTVLAPLGELEVSPAAIRHFVVLGRPFPPARVVLRNAGDGSFTFAFDSAEEPWLGSATPASGTVAPGASRTIDFPISTPLERGEYTATITLSTDALGAESVEIPLSLAVVDEFTVTTLADSGPGSLRAAIDLANATPGAQEIRFAVAGAIEVQSQLPPLSDTTGGTTIEGGLTVLVDGHRLRGIESGLVITSADNVINGLGVVRFPANGILVTGPGARGNLIIRSLIGTNGVDDMGNLQSGIRLDGDSFGTVIGGESTLANTISGNSFSGVTIAQSSGNVIRGNNLGTTFTGGGFIGNGGHGFHLLPVPSSNNIIGGSVLFESNTIAGNAFFGGSLDVLAGRTVRLRALVHENEDEYDYQWFGPSGAVGSGREVVLSNIQKGARGSYFCVISNADGDAQSKTTFVNVIDRAELAALALLPAYADLDLDGDGGLSYNEAATFASRAFGKAAKGTGALTLEEFNALDTNGDGRLSFQELLQAAPIALEDVRYQITPVGAEFSATDIDDGASPPQEFTIGNLELATLEIMTTPTLAGAAAADFRILADDGGERLAVLASRAISVVSDPSVLNERAAYLVVNTDDFLLPTYHILLSGFGFQTTPELLDTLLRRSQQQRQRGEVDVNEDGALDASDIRGNRLNGF